MVLTRMRYPHQILTALSYKNKGFLCHSRSCASNGLSVWVKAKKVWRYVRRDTAGDLKPGTMNLGADAQNQTYMSDSARRARDAQKKGWANGPPHWNLEPGTWNLEPGTWTLGISDLKILTLGI